MPLPSQTGRSSSHRSHMFRRKRMSRRPLMVIALLVAVVGVFWWGPWRGEAENPVPKNVDPPSSEQAVQDTPPSTLDSKTSGFVATDSTLTAVAPTNTDIPDESPHIATPDEAFVAMANSTPKEEEIDEENLPPMGIPEPSLVEPAARRPALLLREEGIAAIDQNDPLRGRRLLTDALETGLLSSGEQEDIRQRLMKVNDLLVFSPQIIPGDPFARAYNIQKNDSLSTLPKKNDLAIDWRLLQRINRVSDPGRIRLGQSIKLITGPFHAVISKREFRMDIHLGQGADRVYVCSFPVGLGEYNGTPVGIFKVRSNSKVINPEWVNPRTGERFRRDDPLNPIGERWIGLEGLSEPVKNMAHYGIHGTIDLDSIGKNESMGCIRLLPEDIELVYELLTSKASVIEIR